MKKTSIVGIVSVKGGVGKTSVTSNLGAVLANCYNREVLLIDANFSAPNLAMHLGLVDPEHCIQDVLDGKKHVFATIHDFEKTFHYVPARYSSKRAKWSNFKRKVKALKGKYDYILLDASPAGEIQATIDASDSILVVLSPDFPTVSTTIKTIKLIEKSRKPILGLVLNRVHRKRFELTQQEIEETLGYPVLVGLPEDKKMMKSLHNMRPFTLSYPGKKLTRKYKELGSKVTGDVLKSNWLW
jgi:septum site-determining protein MinD